MTILENRFMEIVPHKLREIEDALNASRTRLVQVNADICVNPNEISSLYCYRPGSADNQYGGRVSLRMKNQDTFETKFRTAEQTIQALGIN